MPVLPYRTISLFRFFLVLLPLYIVGCKKESPKEIPVLPNTITVSKITVDSLDQNGFLINYKLSAPAKTSGIIYAIDSAALADNIVDKTIEKDATPTGNLSYSASIKNPENVTNTVYWYKIFMVDNDGKTYYSNISKQVLAPYQIYSKYIVKGPSADNDFSMDYNGLMVITTNGDLNSKNYSATINGTKIPVAEIIHYAGTNPYNYLKFDVPENIAFGPAVFTLSYKNNIIYTANVIIVGGGYKFATKHPEQYPYGSHFTYKNELYFLTFRDLSNEGVSFRKWNPAGNIWTKLPNPPNDWSISELGTHTGHEINGVIYFPPVTFQNTYIDGVNAIYSEYMYTYNPSTGVWDHIKLYQSNEKNKVLKAFDSFVYNNKLYCVLQETTGEVGQQTESDIIKVYDPANGTWQKVMELPFNAWDRKATVLNGSVYLLTTLTGKQYSAITEFANKIYMLNLEEKKLINKADLSGNGVMDTYKPYLFAYHNKVYVYGGYSSVGYSTGYNTLFAIYYPDTDKWGPASNTFTNARMSQTDGFIVQLNGEMYIGAGYNDFNNAGGYTILNPNIYQMLLQ